MFTLSTLVFLCRQGSRLLGTLLHLDPKLRTDRPGSQGRNPVTRVDEEGRSGKVHGYRRPSLDGPQFPGGDEGRGRDRTRHQGGR